MRDASNAINLSEDLWNSGEASQVAAALAEIYSGVPSDQLDNAMPFK
jgi:hypothetical protein